MRRQPRSSSIGSTFSVEQETPEIKNSVLKKVAKCSSRSQEKKAVTWSAKATVRSIPGISHLSEEELNERYYRRKDKEYIKDDIHETAFLMNQGVSENDELTFRGLERWRTGVAKWTELHRNMVCRTVIASSNKQLSRDSIDDDDVLGDMCRSLTLSSSAVEEQERAAKDALEIAGDWSLLTTVSLCSTKSAVVLPEAIQIRGRDNASYEPPLQLFAA